MTVRAARSKFALSCLPQEDFPAIAEDDLPHRFEMPAADLRKLIDKSRFAISTEETRYYLNGIYLHAPEDTKVLRGVATDGHRLRCDRFLIKAKPGIYDIVTSTLKLIVLANAARL